MNRRRLTLCVVVVGALTFQCNIASSQGPYRWWRTGESLAARSRVDVVAQGVSNFDQDDVGPTTSGFVASFAQIQEQGPALGGGGGGGGFSGFMAPFVFDGLDGNDADPVPGEDGAPGDQYAGKGGQPGDDGEATASGTALCIDETNPDLDVALSYSWIHNQWGDIAL
ncbi:MAG TPA: hypothetical protein VMP01_06550, partial [Pirellulaceae bacterium]|nr:hypothetical protein [Pirellulaceae bacterium]